MVAGYPDPAANYVVAILFPVIGTVLVGVRFVLRMARKMPLELDDWFCLPALLFVWGCAGALIWGIKQQTFGYHSPSAITPENAMPTIMKIGTSIEAAYIFVLLSYLALGFTKLSILFFYRRIFRGKVFNIVTWIVITVVTLWMLVFSLTWLFSCGNHPRVLWTQFSVINSRCINIFNQMVAGAVVDWVLDITVLVLPCAMVWQLQMPLRQKFYVMGIFLTGIISLIAGILRFVVSLAVANFGNSAIAAGNYSSIDIASMSGHTLGVSKADWLGITTVSIFWAMVEVSAALIAINLPALRPGQALRNSSFYRWLSGITSSLRFSSRGSGSRGSGSKGSSKLRGFPGEKKMSDASDSSGASIPMQGPWPSLATQGKSFDGKEEDEEWGRKGGIGMAIGETGREGAGAIYCERDWQVTESPARTDMSESDFRRRYEELFPPGSAYVVREPRERV
ncbi:hypothetical protein EV356DRAFT_134050 [Viridothelium virens]|uniref:Rhodopsin domain-containing protein n=1 Tax=Viridothelium virens TaxID=1048519 RepID=A0A6A6HC04_VIRVR|nr:hypothetical protein EV356DRAFT_134050 [Viridothelium virens]